MIEKKLRSKSEERVDYFPDKEVRTIFFWLLIGWANEKHGYMVEK